MLVSSFLSRATESIPAEITLISGCRDSQYSSDVSNISEFELPDPAGRSGGACTSALLRVLYDADGGAAPPTSSVDALCSMREHLRALGFDQVPQLSSSRPADLRGEFRLVPQDASRRHALLIGINYGGTSSQLRGCHHDVGNVARYLTGVLGFAEGDIEILADDGIHTAPTRDNILRAYRDLAARSAAGDGIVCSYSGHGGRLPRVGADDEPDGYDETIVPSDAGATGQIRDDLLFETLVVPMPAGVRLFFLMDSCHSGTALDLPYVYQPDDGGTAARAVPGYRFPHPALHAGRSRPPRRLLPRLLLSVSVILFAAAAGALIVTDRAGEAGAFVAHAIGGLLTPDDPPAPVRSGGAEEDLPSAESARSEEGGGVSSEEGRRLSSAPSAGAEGAVPDGGGTTRAPSGAPTAAVSHMVDDALAGALARWRHNATAGAALDGDLSSWDVSHISNWTAAFRGADGFNADLSSWDVSGGTTVAYFLAYAANFNGDLSGWDVSRVRSTEGLFKGASGFDGDLAGWDVSGVTEFSHTFSGATVFNGDVSTWDVSNGRNMRRMFSAALSFDQDISRWAVGKVSDMSFMFTNCSNFNQDISEWNVGRVSFMNHVFARASNFNQNIFKWNVTSVKRRNKMFFFGHKF